MRRHLLIAIMLFVFTEATAQKAASSTPQLDCLSCHSDSTLTSDSGGKTHSIQVDGATFGASAHGALSCTDCHIDIKNVPHEPAPGKVNCATCHADEQSAYQHSVHAKALKANSGMHAPACLDCHGKAHEILPSSDPKSLTSHTNIPATCGSCHGEKFVMQTAGLTTQPFLSYQQSIHGKSVAAGNQKAAVCTDCHNTHEILAASESNSTIFKFNVPNTCGQCHNEVAHKFQASIHGQALQRGNWQAPVCTDCHGIHTIKGHNDPSSPVAAQNLALDTCSHCHEGMRLSREFGVPGERTSSYLNSYHGMASRLGSPVVANCASCHGVHDILPSSDPNSSINPAHLVETCGKCHSGATAQFSLSKVHVDVPLSKDAGSIGTRWVRRLYLLLIALVVGGMVFHNFLLWRRNAIKRLHDRARTVERMNRTQRWQHMALLVSFFVLAVTGFALKYPNSWLAGLLGYNEAFRRMAHRIAAVVLVAASIYHVGYVARTREGWRLFRDFLPTLQDLRDLTGTVLYNLGLRSEAPKFGRFSYAEKMEYLSLIWGTMVMAVTGFMLWFPTTITRHLPRWVVDVGGAIHFYEAILAVLGIIVWHLYFEIFDSEVYPINWAFWDGKVTKHFMESHHGKLGEAEPVKPQEAKPSEAKPIGTEPAGAESSGDD